MRNFSYSLSGGQFIEICVLLMLSFSMTSCGLVQSSILGSSSSSSLSACAENQVVTSPCEASESRYVTSTAGGNITTWLNPTQSTSLTATVPNGFYLNKTVTFSDANLIANNIKNGVSIFGVTGTLIEGALLYSNMHHTKGASPLMLLSAETTTYSGTNTLLTGYNPVPRIQTDSDGLDGADVTRATRPTADCGLTQATIALRIANCLAQNPASATWDGSMLGNAGFSVWKLVARNGANNETWRDERTGLLWTSRVAFLASWCYASGSNNIGGNPFAEADPNSTCDSNDNGSGKAISACFEDDGTYFTNVDSSIDNSAKGNLGINSTPKIAWRLPTMYDFMLAHIDGIMHVMPDLGAGNTYDWTATTRGENANEAWLFHQKYGNGWNYNTRGSSNYVRCVGR